MERIKNFKLNTLPSSNQIKNNVSFGSINYAQNLNQDSFEFSNDTLKNSVSKSSILTKDFDSEFLALDLIQYSKTGIPLKYKRKNLIQDIEKIIEPLNQEEKIKTLLQFGLYYEEKDINGIAIIPKETPSTKEGQKIKEKLEKFYYDNEFLLKNSKQKELFKTLHTFLPEFNMVIGKKQGGVHEHSLDIHTLLIIQSALKNPLYQELSDEDKKVLFLSALMHDFGKKGSEITPGHAYLSEHLARNVLASKNLNQETKERILKQIRNHHWFSDYNQHWIDESNVIDIFKTPQDLKIAKILAKGDLENINSYFHLSVIQSGNFVTPEVFEKEFKRKTDRIQL